MSSFEQKNDMAKDLRDYLLAQTGFKKISMTDDTLHDLASHAATLRLGGTRGLSFYIGMLAFVRFRQVPKRCQRSVLAYFMKQYGVLKDAEIVDFLIVIGQVDSDKNLSEF